VCTQLTCFTGYKSTNTDIVSTALNAAAPAQFTCFPAQFTCFTSTQFAYLPVQKYKFKSPNTGITSTAPAPDAAAFAQFTWLLVQKYKKCPQFACFTSTKVQILT
jgi:hypothetical protein